MPAVRADWHLHIDLPEGDPFASAPQTPSFDPHERLAYLVLAESRLCTQGIHCPIKDAPGTVCHACPVNHSHEDHPLAVLCRISIEQEKIVTTLEAARDRQAICKDADAQGVE